MKDFIMNFIDKISLFVIMSIFVYLCTKKVSDDKNEDGSFTMKYSRNLILGLLFLMLIFIGFIILFVYLYINDKDIRLFIPISVIGVFIIVIFISILLLKRRKIFIKGDTISVKPIIGKKYVCSFKDIKRVIYYNSLLKMGDVKVVLYNGNKIKFDRRFLNNVDLFDGEIRLRNIEQLFW